MLENVTRREQPATAPRFSRTSWSGSPGGKSQAARVKPECVELYPAIDPHAWYIVVQEGEYKDDLEGLWIRVDERVTYVLARHFDLQTASDTH